MARVISSLGNCCCNLIGKEGSCRGIMSYSIPTFPLGVFQVFRPRWRPPAGFPACLLGGPLVGGTGCGVGVCGPRGWRIDRAGRKAGCASGTAPVVTQKGDRGFQAGDTPVAVPYSIGEWSRDPTKEIQKWSPASRVRRHGPPRPTEKGGKSLRPQTVPPRWPVWLPIPPTLHSPWDPKGGPKHCVLQRKSPGCQERNERMVVKE